MDKSKWDTSDWWDWILSHSDDAVVAELKSQADLLREALEVLMYSPGQLNVEAATLIPKLRAALEVKP